MIDKCIYCKLITRISIVNICHNMLLSGKFSFGKRAFAICSLGDLQTCNPGLLAVTPPHCTCNPGLLAVSPPHCTCNPGLLAVTPPHCTCNPGLLAVTPPHCTCNPGLLAMTPPHCTCNPGLLAMTPPHCTCNPGLLAVSPPHCTSLAHELLTSQLELVILAPPTMSPHLWKLPVVLCVYKLGLSFFGLFVLDSTNR